MHEQHAHRSDERLVMVVENDADVREIVAEVLAARGFRALVAEHGADALAQLSLGARPDVILLDLKMPVMDGWAFLDVKARIPEIAAIPVVAMSAMPSEVVSGDARCAGVMKKPVSLDQLLETIQRFSGAHS